jgi:hypothetical protein
MAYTLFDYAQLAPSNLVRGVIDVFRRESFIMDHLAFPPVKGLQETVTRTAGLPAVGFRKIGETFGQSKATFEPVTERIFDLGGFIDVDKILVKADPSQMAVHTDAFVTAISYEFNDYFINGDPTVDVDGFTGLWYRLQNFLPARQTVTPAALVDVSPDSAALAVAFNNLLDGIDSTISVLEGHMATLFLVNRTLWLRLNSGLRQLNLFAQDIDQYGRSVMRFGTGGPWIYDLGTQADQATEIITNTENLAASALTGGTATSLYAMRTGGNFLSGMQLYGLDVQRIGLLESGVAYRTVIDWPIGIKHVNPRAIARLTGTVAA